MRVYDIRKCKHCGISFERKVRAAKVYCSPQCRKLASKASDYEVIKRWHVANPKCSMVRTLRHRAKKKGLAFDLTVDDLHIPTHCPVLGIEIRHNHGTGAGGKGDSVSVDRIDSSKGYVRGNIMVMSQLANAMKSSATPEQLLAFAEWVLKTYRKEEVR